MVDHIPVWQARHQIRCILTNGRGPERHNPGGSDPLIGAPLTVQRNGTTSLGAGAPLSGSTVAPLKEKWQGELANWQIRPLDDIEAVYCWVDGIYVKADLEKDKAGLLVVLTALSDGRRWCWEW
jgi:hypothetical protein